METSASNQMQQSTRCGKVPGGDWMELFRNTVSKDVDDIILKY